MKVVICILPIICFLISMHKYKAWNNPYVIFNILWSVVGILILCGNKSVYTPSITAMLCVITGIIGFNLSALSRRIILGNRSVLNVKYMFNPRRAAIISTIVLIVSFFLSIDAIRSLLVGISYSDIRNDYYTYDGEGSVLLYYFREYIIDPLRYVVIVSAIFAIFKKEYRSKLLILNASFCVLLQVVSNGGRYILMNTFFMIICGALILNCDVKLSLKQKMEIVFFGGILAYGLIFLTNSRATYLMQNMTIGEKMFSTVYQYFAGSITYLGEVIKNTPNIKGATYGVNFVAGWISPLFVILNYIGILSYPQVFSVIGTEACKVLKIGENLYYNAMPTVFGYFYIDGGLVLTFIEAWIWGYICKRLYTRAENGNLLFTAVYILMFLQICNASTRWFLYSTGYCLAFIYMRLVFDREKFVEEE